ncbi:retrovirus-related pol polyprotein from transposon TNT 1-94 [Tanacetum coccineum]|uniref:Retrovirus-related pol polyprotein from transposon TNT 1-94 n=1 Tax=Tanacetum coccineum TaxID=301880 RepID=A0ABQ5BSX0_9ASTR
MGYHFYNPHENKVFVARHDELFENSLKCTRSEWESHFAKSISGNIDDVARLFVNVSMLYSMTDIHNDFQQLTSLSSAYDNFMKTLLYGRESLNFEDFLSTLNSQELKKRTDAKADGDGLFVRGRSDQRGNHGRGSLRSKSKGKGIYKLKCYICYSEDHLKKDCPKRNKKKSTGFVKKNAGQGSGMHPEGYDNGDLLMAGYTVKLQNGRVKVIKGSLMVLSGSMKENYVYSLVGWAELGEASVGLHELERREVLGNKGLGKLKFFENCVFGKSTRVSFGGGQHTTEGVIDYVHTDLWGPSQVESMSGFRYFLLIVDDYLRRVWVHFLRHKNDVLASSRSEVVGGKQDRSKTEETTNG